MRKITKRITPTEFSLHQKVFDVEYSPSNYFEKFRVELAIQCLVGWFFAKYGYYIYIHQVQLKDHHLLFQVYFYPTYLYPRFVRTFFGNYEAQGGLHTNFGLMVDEDDDDEVDNLLGLTEPSIWIKVVDLWKIHTQLKKFNCVYLVNSSKFKLKKKKRFTKKIITAGNQVYRKWLVINSRLKKGMGRTRKRIRRKIKIKGLTIIPNISLNFYFTYFFQHYFSVESAILYRNLAKWLFASRTLKREHRRLLFKTRYLQKYQWSFDLYFFTHFALTYSNPNFLLQLFTKIIESRIKHKKFIRNFADILTKFYWLKKKFIGGIKLMLHGVYDRHGRSRAWVWQVGTMHFTSDKSLIFYDWISFTTFYGVFSLKIWVAYKERSVKRLIVEPQDTEEDTQDIE